MSKVEKLVEAMQTGEILTVIYHGGSQPGSSRMIFPRSISGDNLKAICLASNQLKTFKLEKIELVSNSAEKSDYTPTEELGENPNSKREMIDLSKKAAVSLKKHNVFNVDATVALVLDVSKSMNPLYKNGTIQAVIERVLGLAMKFDSRDQVDAFVFGTGAKELEPISLEDFEGYVEREIIAKHNINQATQYAKAIELVNAKYFGKLTKPIYVIFITDGDDSDKNETSAWMRQICRQPIFWKFVGIGKEEFKFLDKLDNLDGRAIDNAHFFQVNDIAKMSDEDLYDNLLTEFPQWLEIVRKKGIVKG